MKTAENQYPRFRDLEELTKTGLVAYLILFTAGTIIAASGVDAAYSFMRGVSLCESLLITVVSLNVVFFLIRGVNKIHWLGELHVWLDKTLFRFLFKSNEIIFREFTSLLGPDERAAFVNRSPNEQTVIVQSILSHLAEDPSILKNLLRKGMFRSWIWYWINLHGIFVFTILTAITLVKFVVLPTIYSKSFFIAIAVVAVLHLLLSIGSGFNIVVITKRIVREMIHRHQASIITFLRNYLLGKSLQR